MEIRPNINIGDTVILIDNTKLILSTQNSKKLINGEIFKVSDVDFLPPDLLYLYVDDMDFPLNSNRFITLKQQRLGKLKKLNIDV